MASRKKPQHGAAARKKRSTGGGRTSSSRTRATSKSSGSKSASRAKATRSKSPSRSKTAPRSKPVRPKSVTRSKAASRPKSSGTKASRSTGGAWRALLIPLVVVALMAVMVWSFYPVARIQYQESREKARLEAELAGLQERNAQLRSQVDRLKTPEGVEEVARESLGMVKDGEHVYVVTNLLEETTGTVAGCTSIADPPPTFSQSILDSVFGFGE